MPAPTDKRKTIQIRGVSVTGQTPCSCGIRRERAVSEKNWNEHTSSLFKSTNILKLCDLNKFDLNKFQVACFVYKCIHNNLPSLFCSYFVLNSEVHGYNTTQECHLVYTEYNLELMLDTLQ